MNMEKTLFRVKVMKRRSSEVLSDSPILDLYTIANSMDHTSGAALRYCAKEKGVDSGLYVKEGRVVASTGSHIPLVVAD